MIAKNKFFQYLSVFILLFFFHAISAYSQKKDFRVFDAIMIKNKPNLASAGLSKINMFYEDDLIYLANKNRPNDGVISQIKLNSLKNKVITQYPICLDIECWALDDKYSQASIPKYINASKQVKAIFPKSKIGIYGVLPYNDLDLYTNKIAGKNQSSNAGLYKWHSLNNRLTSIAKVNDIAYPSAYTRSNSKEDWFSAFKIQIQKAREIAPNAKVYVFLWPQFFARDMDYNETFIDSNFWQFQLECAYQYCDGIVLWLPPYNQRKNGRVNLSWNENDGWWIKTKEFIKSKGITSNTKS